MIVAASFYCFLSMLFLICAVICMGNVSVVVKVYPEDPSKIDELKARLAEAVNPKDVKVEDVGFGVRLLRVMVIVPDTEGGTVEERIRALPGVSEVQAEDVTLV